MKGFLKGLLRKQIATRMDILDHEAGMLLARNSFVTQLTDHRKIRTLLRDLRPVKDESKELIRLGPAGDGGYLVPDDLDGLRACFSPGAGRVSGFESDCARAGMKVFLADNSVEAPADPGSMFHFTKKHVGVTTDDCFMTIDDWVSTCMPDSNSELLLQVDIEGAEYEVLLNMSDRLLRRSRIIVVEFHGLQHLWSQPYFDIAARAFEKLLQTHYCVHIHPNNCCGSIVKKGLEIPRVAEFTFLRRDRMSQPSVVSSFPHPLDHDNTPNPHLALPSCWYH